MNLEDWINKEGIPLEYYTANCFQRNKFTAYQGHFVRDETGNREIDVEAKVDYNWDKKTIRVTHVVECKWTKDKPWVVFTSNNSRYAPSASVTQTIGNKIAQAALWHIAGNKDVCELSIFNDIAFPGFSGRQAFGNSDQFYSAVQSIVTKTYLLANRYPIIQTKLFDFTHVTFPVIVIDGQLHKAMYNLEKDIVEVQEVEQIRLNWRGSNTWKLNARVDIVTKGYLGSFLDIRRKEIDILVRNIVAGLQNIHDCHQQKDMKLLTINSAPRGIMGYPVLINEIANEIKKSKTLFGK